MTPSPNDRLKTFVWKSDRDDDEIVDITNDAGNPDEEFDIIDTLDLPTAERLVACWNACRGISTKQLEIVASYKNDESRLSWLGESASRASRGVPFPEPEPPTYTKAELDALNANPKP